MSTLIAELVEALEENLPPMPPKDARCHAGICSQDKCAHCGRVARGYAALARARSSNPITEAMKMALTAEEAEFVLKEFLADEQRRLRTVLKPYMDELSHVSMRKPPLDTHLPDGRIMRYVGPTADDLGGPYRAPRWLEELCCEDMRFIDALRRIKRHLGEQP